MKWLLLIKWLMFCSTIHAATVRVYNRSNKPVNVKIKGFDLGQGVGAAFTILGTGGSMGKYHPHYDVSHSLAPGESAWFDSGLSSIDKIDFYIPEILVKPIGGYCYVDENKKQICKEFDKVPLHVEFKSNIGTYQVEQKVEYYSPTDIRKL